MRLLLARTKKLKTSTLGTLYVAGDFSLKTLERPDPMMIGAVAPFCIPCGTYKIEMYNSPAHQCICPLLKDVPGRSDIEIHIGNYPKDSKGCILVGHTQADDYVGESREAFEQLMKTMALYREGWEIVVSDVVIPEKPLKK